MVLSGISASYSSGTVTVTLTGTNAGQVYPVTISLVNGGTMVKLTTSQRDWRRDNDDRHHLCRSVCGSTYMVTCGDQSFVLVSDYPPEG